LTNLPIDSEEIKLADGQAIYVEGNNSGCPWSAICVFDYNRCGCRILFMQRCRKTLVLVSLWHYI